MGSRTRSRCRLALCALAAFTLSQAARAQENCPSSPPLGKALTNGDGQRYPLAIGPVTWHLLGSGIYPVSGSDGQTHVAFAMAFTNPWSGPTTIQSVEVVDPSRDNQSTGTDRVLSLDDKDVTGRIRLIPTNSNGDAAGYTARLEGGQSGVMYFDVSYEKRSEVPCFLALRVHSVQPEIKVMPESTLVGPPLSVSPKAPIVIAPPFKGEGWMDANGCCLEIGPHRFVINAMNGTLDPSEGFAIDWVKVDRQGMAFRTDGKKPEDWLCYGTDVLAVAPGTVVEVMRNLPNEPPGVAPTNLKIPEIAGNHVILDLGDGRYAMYAHLAPQSVTVHVGDHVKTGDKLGLLGNSGNTTGPHLHFQISDQPSTLAVTALPFTFESMSLQGRTSLNLDDIDSHSIKGIALPIDRTSARPLRGVMPLSRDIVDFP